MWAEITSGAAVSASLIAAALRSEWPSTLSSTNTVRPRPELRRGRARRGSRRSRRRARARAGGAGRARGRGAACSASAAFEIRPSRWRIASIRRSTVIQGHDRSCRHVRADHCACGRRRASEHQMPPDPRNTASMLSTRAGTALYVGAVLGPGVLIAPRAGRRGRRARVGARLGGAARAVGRRWPSRSPRSASATPRPAGRPRTRARRSAAAPAPSPAGGSWPASCSARPPSR